MYTKVNVKMEDADMRLLKRVTQMIMVLMYIFVICICSIACGDNENNSEKIAAIELPEDEIIFISRYQAWDLGYLDSGYFVDTDGAVYAFDFSQYTYDMQNDEELFLKKLWVIRNLTEPFATIDIEVLKEIYYYGMMLDMAAEYSKEWMGCDMGQHSLIFRNAETDASIVFYEDGDVRGELQDASARHLVSVYEEYMMDKFVVKDYPHIYTYTTISGFDCGYVENEGKYIIFNEEQLHKVEAVTGYQLLDMTNERIDFDEYVYLVEFKNVPSTGYDLKASAIMYYNGAFDFITSSDSVYPGENDVVGEVMGGFCFIAEYPKAEFPYSEHGYKDFSGGNWLVLEE